MVGSAAHTQQDGLGSAGDGWRGGEGAGVGLQDEGAWPWLGATPATAELGRGGVAGGRG